MREVQNGIGLEVSSGVGRRALGATELEARRGVVFMIALLLCARWLRPPVFPRPGPAETRCDRVCCGASFSQAVGDLRVEYAVLMSASRESMLMIGEAARRCFWRDGVMGSCGVAALRCL